MTYTFLRKKRQGNNPGVTVTDPAGREWHVKQGTEAQPEVVLSHVLWALGYHQCRWGYESFDDLDRLDRSFRKHRVADDGLWLDIDYMDRFKVFTFARKNFSNPRRQIASLRQPAQRGRIPTRTR